MIDRYDAPAGMVAVSGEQKACVDCACNRSEIDCCVKHRCLRILRKDKEPVIFKTRAEFLKMLIQELELFYGNGKIKKLSIQWFKKKDSYKKEEKCLK